MSAQQQSRPMGERLINSSWRFLLFPFWIIYQPIVRIRNWCYDLGIIHQATLNIPIISVGNIIAGGSGKTPMVNLLIELLQDHGSCGVLSRGYKGDGTSNDEAALMDAPVYCNSKRVLAGKAAVEDGVEIAILDDGFQHRALKRDLDIVLIDATRPWGFVHSLRGATLPLGFLREPPSSLQRADLLILTRCDQVSSEWLDHIKKQCARFQKPILQCKHQASHLTDADDQRIELDQHQLNAVYCVSGIAHPSAFAQTVRDIGLNIAGRHNFDDHHHYSANEVAKICKHAKELQADVLCTSKDAVKLNPLWPKDAEAPKLLTVHVQMSMSEADTQQMQSLLEACLSQKRQTVS